MSVHFPTRLVRGWVALYTRGLPAEVRTDRIDEIESDLWSQCEEADSSGESGAALARAILTRWLLGMGADVAWRLERERLANRNLERTTTTGTRIIAVLAIIGAVGLTIAAADWGIIDLGNPGANAWDQSGWTIVAVASAAGIVALSLSLGGLGFVLAYRYDSPIGLMGALGACGGVLGLMGAYTAMILLPVGSVAVILYLARIHALGWSLAALHVASAPGVVVGLAAYSDSSLLGISVVLVLAYSVTWVVIGLELLRGLPVVQAPVQSAT